MADSARVKLATTLIAVIGELQNSMDLRRFGSPLGRFVPNFSRKSGRATLTAIIASALLLGACSTSRVEESDLEINDPY